ncbi:MAG TPA: hypothetical protein VMM60_18955 [Ilumatobacter sp.]|nr:hypothetical protein [Ilumatobacter sp.]
MTDHIGMFEHADHAMPRREHGYCTDDMARLLIVTVREPGRSRVVRDLEANAFRFLAASQTVTGRTRNRRDANGKWHGRASVEDCWGRSVWAFGSAAQLATDEGVRSSASSYFNHAVRQRSPHQRSMVFAALGAAAYCQRHPRHQAARDLLSAAVDAIGTSRPDAEWPWPEDRLTYANAAVADALIGAGYTLGRDDVLADGLLLLRWLISHETADGHLRLTPVGGADAGGTMFQFDQQPIEAAALADACRHAYDATGDDEWLAGLDLAIGWFTGDNDLGAVMWDPATNGGYDGLTPTGPNLNQGAESTLALISTMQHDRWRRTGVDGATPIEPSAAGPVWSTR